MKLIITSLGLAHNLAMYFGDKDVVPDDMCTKCTFCTTGESTEFPRRVTTTINPAQIQAILNACPDRDDPRLLARMAFGITSPRLTVNKWSTSHPLFGSMHMMDFKDLLAAFDEECKKCGYERAETVSLPPKKRSYSGDNSRTGRGFKSRGGPSKKARA